ncbi:hypothetical protein DFH94DRAFT_741791 [Russula ochroleuca]|uniref:Uncharacterized protein n=1 Tax=Russula ochroleuca TaxID=152965 RepID=A0A9P5MWE6_9AGAM|nr:hypothetical protein DFH94DRAFT_741791 [Russula ochroleuca]
MHHVALYVALCQINNLQSSVQGRPRTQHDYNSPQLAVESLYSLRHRPLVIPSSTWSHTLDLTNLPFSRFTYICLFSMHPSCAVMSLSVSSFPEAPPKVPRPPKWQETLSLKSSGKFLGSLLNKRPVPFLKGIGHLAKTHVKESIIHLRVNVPRCRAQHPSSLSRPPIQSSSFVIDIIPIPNCDECSSDASSLGPTIEFSASSRSISPAASSTPSTANTAISTTDTVKPPHRSSQSLVEDPTHAHEEDERPPVPPPKDHVKVASVVCNSEPHDYQPSDSDATITLPISPPLTTQPPATPSQIPRLRSHSVSAAVKAPAATETVPPTRRPRYKSETAVGSRRRTASSSPPDDSSSSSSSERKGSSNRGKNSTSVALPPLPSSAHTSSISPKQQKRETRSKRARSGASSKSMGSNSSKTAESPVILSTNHFRPKTSNGVSTRVRSRSHSPSLVVSPLDGASQPPPLPLPPNSLDRGTWLRLVALPHAESGIPVRGSGSRMQQQQQQQQYRPRAASEAVLTTSR